METVYTKYIPAVGSGVNFLKVEVYYSLGGLNYFTSKSDPRGYYLSITPVKREDHNGYVSESVVLGSGVKTLIKETKRKSEQAAMAAKDEAVQYENRLIDHILLNSDIKICSTASKDGTENG